jgi:hypothetical protein
MARKENEEKERFAKHLEELRITREAKEAKRENIDLEALEMIEDLRRIKVRIQEKELMRLANEIQHANRRIEEEMTFITAADEAAEREAYEAKLRAIELRKVLEANRDQENMLAQDERIVLEEECITIKEEPLSHNIMQQKVHVRVEKEHRSAFDDKEVLCTDEGQITGAL